MLRDNSTVDGGERVTLFENQPKIDPLSVQRESSLRDPSHGVSLNEELVRKCAGSKDDEISVEGDEATPMPPIEHQGQTENLVPGSYIECYIE